MGALPVSDVDPLPDDRLLRLATSALGAPIALRVRVLAGVVTIAARGRLVPELQGAVASALALDAVALVPDLQADPRFAGGPWARAVAEGRAVAVAPVRDHAGGAGALMVMDVRPRDWSDEDREALVDLADLAARTAGLRHREALLSATVHSFPDGSLMVFDQSLRYVIAGGTGGAQVEGKTLAEVVTPEVLAKVEPLYRAVLRGKDMVERRTEDGRTFATHRCPVRDRDGTILAGLVTAHDVSDVVVAEHARRDVEERFRVLFERAEHGILIMEADRERRGVILEANAKAAADYGYSRRELVGRNMRTLVDPDAQTLQARAAQLDAGEWIEFESTHIRKDGTRFPVECESGLVYAGGKRLFVVFERDVSVRRHAEEEIRVARKAAEEANRAKSAFLANMSHEIRTPMNAILGYAQLLQRSPRLDDRERQYLDVISRSGDHLLELINDVLEMSKIEAGYRKVNRGALDLQSLLGDIERLFRLRTEAKHLGLEINRAPEVPRYVVTDEGKLRQILVNLLGNAVKFTEHGGIVVRLFVRQAEGGERRLVVAVDDTGPGISAAEVAGLFKPFVQARAGLEAQGGTGLGLALSREFARLMGGDVTVASTVGKGSVFEVDLPLEVAPPASPPRGSRYPGRVVGILTKGPPPRILVADDQEDNRSWLRSLLEQVGFEVREAANGRDALAMFDAWTPRAALIDLHMPVLDGLSTIRALRARPGGRALAIVVVTASAFDETQAAIFDAGADGWIRKPCREPALLHEISRLIGVEYRYGTPYPSPLTPGQPSPMARDVALPPELAKRLREAAHVADYEQLTALVEALPAEHAGIAGELRGLLERYAYDEIERRVGAAQTDRP